MVVVGDEGFVIVGVLGPLTMDHLPEPDVGATASIVTEVFPQTGLSGPASACEGAGSDTKTETSSDELHAPLVIVYLKT